MYTHTHMYVRYCSSTRRQSSIFNYQSQQDLRFDFSRCVPIFVGASGWVQFLQGSRLEFQATRLTCVRAFNSPKNIRFLVGVHIRVGTDRFLYSLDFRNLSILGMSIYYSLRP